MEYLLDDRLVGSLKNEEVVKVFLQMFVCFRLTNQMEGLIQHWSLFKIGK